MFLVFKGFARNKYPNVWLTQGHIVRNFHIKKQNIISKCCRLLRSNTSSSLYIISQKGHFLHEVLKILPLNKNISPLLHRTLKFIYIFQKYYNAFVLNCNFKVQHNWYICSIDLHDYYNKMSFEMFSQVRLQLFRLYIIDVIPAVVRSLKFMSNIMATLRFRILHTFILVKRM